MDLIFELVDGLSVLRGLRLVRIKVFFIPNSYKINIFIVKSIKAGTVMDYHASPTEYYSFNNWCFRKLDIHSGDSHLYFRCHWHAAFWQGLHKRKVLS